MDLRQGEQLIRIHRFRFVKPSGCGLGSIDLMVEEILGPATDGAPRCTARPDHRELVPRPEFTAHGDTVEEALGSCLAAIRPRRFYELFLPAA
ncbi:MAG TPA: hypothetical protein VLT62_22610 [Candidatus Methylomirabilis sp.]|nr:hypothetical protein [Candidatus Methylomirabilis sp.]